MSGQYDHPGYLSKEDVARFLSVSIRTIERLISSGQLPVVQVIRSIRIPATAMHDYINRHTLKSKEWSL